MAAFGILSGFSLTRRLWLWQTKMMIKEADRISDLEGAKEIAQKEGIKEGIAIGEERGAQNKSVEDAVTMILDFDIQKEKVYEKLKLSEEQIAKVEEALLKKLNT